MAGEAITTLLLCVAVKYIIFMVCKFVQIRRMKKGANVGELQQADEISMDSLEENEAEDLLNEEEESDEQKLQLEGEIEMQDFSQAY